LSLEWNRDGWSDDGSESGGGGGDDDDELVTVRER